MGIEANISKLVENGLKATCSAIAGLVAPFALGLLVCQFFELPLIVSLFIGSTLTATSIGITLRVLSEIKRQSSHEAQIVLGAAVIDDIIGIILLSVLYEFSTGSAVQFSAITEIVLFIFVFMVSAPFLAALMARMIKRYDEISTIPGLLVTTVVSLILFFAWLATNFGAPELLGGFAAGLAISHRFFLFLPKPFQVTSAFSDRVEKTMKPIIHLFTPIFFVNIGLLLNLREIAWDSSFVWILSFLLLLAAVIGKLFAGLVLWNESRFVKWAVGISMIPRGEVGLIFADVGKNRGIFDNEIYATMIIVIAMTTVFTPLFIRFFYHQHGHAVE